MKSIFINRNVTIYIKINTIKVYIKWFILLHLCECWTVTRVIERRLEAAEIWYIRRIMKLSWTENKSNEEVMEWQVTKDPNFKKKFKKENYSNFRI